MNCLFPFKERLGVPLLVALVLTLVVIPIRGFAASRLRWRPCTHSRLFATVEDDLSASSSSSSSLSSLSSSLSSSMDAEEEEDDDEDLLLSYWETVGTIATISSPWVTIYCEKLRDNHDELLDYWRVETEHSAVIVTLYKNRLVFPKRQYRPGVGDVTLDFPGGRVPCGMQDLKEIQSQLVPKILQRELGIQDTTTDADNFLRDVWPVSGPAGWIINSSFSNQRLFGFVAILNDNVRLDTQYVHPKTYDPTNRADMEALMHHDLPCLQCRHVLLEYMASCW